MYKLQSKVPFFPININEVYYSATGGLWLALLKWVHSRRAQPVSYAITYGKHCLRYSIFVISSSHLGGVTLDSISAVLLPVYHLMHLSATAALQLIKSESQLVYDRPLSNIFFSGVYLALRGVHITNNSNINISSIGQTSDNPNGALQCAVTDNPRCCSHAGS